MPPETYQPRHSDGQWHRSDDSGPDNYKPRHGADARITEELEWATGRNGRTLLAQIRAHGLDVVEVKA